MKKPGGKKTKLSLTPEEKALWRAHTREMKKLAHVKVEDDDEDVPEPVLPAPVLKRPAPAPRKTLATHLPPAPLAADVLTSMDAALAAKFKKGLLPIEARLDLHGFTREEADLALEKFILRAHAAGKRMLLVITGKGYRTRREDGESVGVIKQAVMRWLGEGTLRPYVLAFAQAQRKDGGAGAFYVLLKRRR